MFVIQADEFDKAVDKHIGNHEYLYEISLAEHVMSNLQRNNNNKLSSQDKFQFRITYTATRRNPLCLIK